MQGTRVTSLGALRSRPLGTHQLAPGRSFLALNTHRTDERVALLGIMQALFEASMYTFVFLWTPALNPHTFLPDAAQTAAGAAPALAASINGGAARHLLAGAGGYSSDSGSSAYHLTLGSSSGGGGGTAGSAFARLPLSAGMGGGDGGDAQPHLPHGLVFAIFMTASMVGTALAGRLMASWRLEAVLQVRRGG